MSEHFCQEILLCLRFSAIILILADWQIEQPVNHQTIANILP